MKSSIEHSSMTLSLTYHENDWSCGAEVPLKQMSESNTGIILCQDRKLRATHYLN